MKKKELNINQGFISKLIHRNADNRIKHVINECEKLKTERNILLGELNEINNTKYEELLKAIEYQYYLLKNFYLLCIRNSVL